MTAAIKAFHLSVVPTRELGGVTRPSLVTRVVMGIAVGFLFVAAVLSTVGVIRTAVGPTVERSLTVLLQPHAAGMLGR